MRNEGAEIGIHAHLLVTWVARAGVNPRATPDASTDDCTAGTTPGYGVLLTGYEEDERARIVDASIQGLTFNGFPPPTTFCAGYSAADPSLQAMLDPSSTVWSPIGPFLLCRDALRVENVVP